MTVIESNLLRKLQKLPAQRLAEVEDFVEFLVAREARASAGVLLGKSLGKLDTLNLSPVSDEEIEAEIQAARLERKVRHA